MEPKDIKLETSELQNQDDIRDTIDISAQTVKVIEIGEENNTSEEREKVNVENGSFCTNSPVEKAIVTEMVLTEATDKKSIKDIKNNYINVFPKPRINETVSADNKENELEVPSTTNERFPLIDIPSGDKMMEGQEMHKKEAGNDSFFILEEEIEINKTESFNEKGEIKDKESPDNEYTVISIGNVDTVECTKSDEPAKLDDGTHMKIVAAQFLESSSLHGLSKVLDRSNLVKFVWSILLAGAFGVAIWQISGLIVTYLSFPVAWEVAIKRNGYSMPAITVCKYKTILKSKMRKHPFFAKELAYFGNRSVPDGFLSGLIMKHRYANDIPYEVMKELGPTADEIVKIKSKGDGPNEVYLQPTSYHSYPGACYSFAPTVNTKTLGIYLNFRTMDFIDPFITDQTMYIYIKDDSESYPFVQPFNLIKANPGQEQHVSFSYDVTNLLNGSYGQCQNYEGEFKRRTGYKYEKELCVLDCLNQVMVKNCNCTYPAILQSWNPDNIQSCYQLNTFTGCFFEHANTNCSCKEKCHEKLYYTTGSQINNAAHEFLKENVCKQFVNSCYTTNFTNWFQVNGGFLGIYLTEKPYKIFSQIPEYPVIRFLSDMGGTFGLYLGASVLSYFEILQFWITSTFLKLNRIARNQ